MSLTKNITTYHARKHDTVEWISYKSISKLHKEIGISRKILNDILKKNIKHEEYEFKTIVTTIPMTSSDIWKENNKDRTSKYNAYYNEKQNTNKTTYVILARKMSESIWIEFDTQIEAAESLNVISGNITKVIQGKLKSTGEYFFKKEEKEETPSNKQLKTWKEICEKNEFKNACIGAPSNHRILHSSINGVEGKKCCTCKEWKMLSNYNINKNNWDGFRADCKDCISKYRDTLDYKTRIKLYNKDYWKKTKEEQTAKHKIWKENNSEHVNEYQKKI